LYEITYIKSPFSHLSLERAGRGTHGLVVYADYVNILSRSVRTIKKTTVALVVSMETELEVDADKTKYVVISRDQNSGRSHTIKMDNSSFERVEHFI